MVAHLSRRFASLQATLPGHDAPDSPPDPYFTGWAVARARRRSDLAVVLAYRAIGT